MVNVLQAVLLTEGEKMIKTPTYHVMHMYRHHQGANLLESALSGVDEIGVEEWKVPKVTESVSKDENGVITITMNNLSASDSEDVEINIANGGYKVVESRIVTSGDIHDYNTFDNSEVVIEKDFSDYEIKGDAIVVKMPANSVIEIRVQK